MNDVTKAARSGSRPARRREIGSITRELVLERGLTQAAVAKKARLARPYVVQLEQAHREPSIATVAKLAKALGVKVSELMD